MATIKRVKCCDRNFERFLQMHTTCQLNRVRRIKNSLNTVFPIPKIPQSSRHLHNVRISVDWNYDSRQIIQKII